MRCGRAQQLLVAAVDGELTARQRRALDRHVTGCEVCADERRTTDVLLGALACLPAEAAVPVALEQATFRRVRSAAALEAERGVARSWMRWLPIPAFAVATAAVAVLAVALVRQTSQQAAPSLGAPSEQPTARVARATKTVTQPEPPEEPPADLAAAPDLFMDLPILRNLEKLSHFDAIRTTTLDDAPGEPASNG